MTSLAKDFAQLDWGLDGHEFASLADAPNDLMQLSVTGKGERLRAVLPPAGRPSGWSEIGQSRGQRPLMQFYARAGGSPHPIAQCI